MCTPNKAISSAEESSDSSNFSDSDESEVLETCHEKNSLNDIENEDEEDELIKAIQAAKKKVRKHPPDITFEELLVDISFHPSFDMIAAATVGGDVFFYKYSNESNELMHVLELHVSSCRDIEFNEDGSILYSCGKDKSIMVSDTATGKLKRFYDNAHDYPLYSLYVFNENLLCTGDEEGTVKIWDMRKAKSVMTFRHMEDFVSDMVTNDDKKLLVCSSGDGTIASFNLPARKLFIRSEEYEAEFNCMQLLKNECKLVAGSSKGRMYLYNWSEFGYHSDEYFGIKNSINSMIAITENIIVAGYEDGNIRAINFFPQKQLGVVGQHQFSIESLDISHDGEYIASTSLDQTIKFWNIRYFEDLHVKKEKSNKKKEMEKNLPSSKVKNAADFFGDL